MSESELSESSSDENAAGAQVPPASIQAKLIDSTAWRIFGITVFGALIGLVCAFLALMFVDFVEYLSHLLKSSPETRANGASVSLWFALGIPIAGGLVSGLLIHFGSKSKKPQGPPDVIRATQARRGVMNLREGLVSTAASVVSLGVGASAGKYGPLAHLGAIVGSALSRLLRAPAQSSIGVGCGVAAAIAAAFNAPIAGLIFAHEVVLRHYSLRAFAPITVASTIGYMMANYVFDTTPLFDARDVSIEYPAEYFAFVVIGLVGALVAVILMRSLAFTRHLARSSGIPGWARPMCAGAMLGLIALWIPDVLGVGDSVIRRGIETQQEVGYVLLLLVAKIIATSICIGFGFVGGVFSPALLIGVLLGNLIGSIVALATGDSHSAIALYAICAMAAVTSPVIGAPLTTILIVFELSGNYDLTTAVMISVVFSNVVGYRVFGRSWYDKELSNDGFDLSLGRDKVILEEKHVSDIVVEDFVRIDSFEPLETVRQQLVESGRADAYVVSESGFYVGTITINQLLALQDTEAMSTKLAGDVATPASIILARNDSIWEAMERIGHFVGETIPVIKSNDDDTLIGVVSESDIVRSYLDTVYELRREEHAAS